jgi:hypothetical protein
MKRYFRLKDVQSIASGTKKLSSLKNHCSQSENKESFVKEKITSLDQNSGIEVRKHQN